jgi:transposase-like protein
MQNTSPDVEQWRRVIAEFEASGQSARAFAEARGLTASALGYWRRRIARDQQPSAPSSALAVSFVEVRSEPVPSARYEVALANGRSVFVGAHFDDVVLARLLHVVEGGV